MRQDIYFAKRESEKMPDHIKYVARVIFISGEEKRKGFVVRLKCNHAYTKYNVESQFLQYFVSTEFFCWYREDDKLDKVVRCQARLI